MNMNITIANHSITIMNMMSMIFHPNHANPKADRAGAGSAPSLRDGAVIIRVCTLC